MNDNELDEMSQKSIQWSMQAQRLMQKLNNFNEPGSSRSLCVPLIVCNERVGILQPELVKQLKNYSNVFIVKGHPKPSHVEINASLDNYETRTKAIAEVIEDLTRKDAFETLRYPRNEDYDVSPGPNQKPLLKMERAATSLFGVRTYGAHMNGFVRHPEKGICIWLARRSPRKQTFPGMLDNMVAGGIGVGFGIRETMIKECYEEASIPEEIARNVISTGCISYIHENQRGVHAEVQYCFDLEIPLDFIPKPMDGEVQEFMLCDIDEVKAKVIQDDFKPNCAAITIDFLIRYGFISPDNESKYCEIIQGIHTIF